MTDRKHPNGGSLDERPPLVPRRTRLEMVRPDHDDETHRRIDVVIDNQVAIVTRLDQQNVDMVAIGLAVGRLETEHRKQAESVPEIVDEAVRLHDTRADAETWRWLKKNATKVMIGALIALSGAELVLHLMGR